MSYKLVIVESPAKSKTIESFLGKDYKVIATVGHIKDLPKNAIGIDIEKEFEPQYVSIKKKGSVMSNLKKSVKESEGIIYLATDPDREGEAIAWQVGEIIESSKKKYTRISFNEITKDAILSAIKNPREIDLNLVSAQKTRRILDRLFGYELSQLLWKKIRYGLSAGRVQSAALKFIVDRERKIKAFVPEKFFNIEAFADGVKCFMIKDNNSIKFKEDEIKKREKILNGITEEEGKLIKLDLKDSFTSSPPPFNTAMLQRMANQLYGFSASRTMRIAQKLYQGVNIKGKGYTGLISYMRTDSFNLSDFAINAARERIKQDYSAEYLSEKVRIFKSKSKVAQEAHEAIRPTHFDIHPQDIKDDLQSEELKIYSLIWYRTLATQMKPAIVQHISFEVQDQNNNVFKGSVERMKFDGFTKAFKVNLLKNDIANNFDTVSKWKLNGTVNLTEMKIVEKFTKPLPRYTESSLVKKMEKSGIGRPSTYATIMSNLVLRGYVLVENRKLCPTDNGIIVCEFLEKYFPNIVDSQFTSDMEDKLDEIANGIKERVKVLGEYYYPFHESIVEGEKNISKEDILVVGESDEKCPECGGKMVIKVGRNGRFLSCSNFPKCKGIKAIEENFNSEKYLKLDKCEQCGAKMILKNGKYGKFWACENYPKCKNAKPLLLIEKCPECGHNLVERKGKWNKTFIGCSNYPKCKYIKKG